MSKLFRQIQCPITFDESPESLPTRRLVEKASAAGGDEGGVPFRGIVPAGRGLS